MTRTEKNKYLHQTLNYANNEFIDLIKRVDVLETEVAMLRKYVIASENSKTDFNEWFGQDPIKDLDEIFKLQKEVRKMCLGCEYCRWDECINEEAWDEENQENIENGTCPFYKEYFPEHPDQHWREE